MIDEGWLIYWGALGFMYIDTESPDGSGTTIYDLIRWGMVACRREDLNGWP